MKGYFLDNLLTESHVLGTALGIFWVVFLFAFCFLLVYFLMRPDRQKQPKQEPTPPPPKQEPKEPSEPVYYIVEKKSKRSKTVYSKPKRIHFE